MYKKHLQFALASLCLSASLQAQVGQLDQTAPAANASFNGSIPGFVWQQEVEVGISGTLEGFSIALQAGQAGGDIALAVRVGGVWNTDTPVWSTVYHVPNHLPIEPFFDLSGLGIHLDFGDLFVIEATHGGVGGVSIDGSGAPALYHRPLWDNGQPSGNSSFGFTTWMIAQIGFNYCSANPNSSGSPAIISTLGSASVLANDLILQAGPVPVGQPGIFYYGPDTLQVPFGDGFRCVGGSVGTVVRVFPFAQGDAMGVLRQPLDNTLPAHSQVTAGAFLNFQAWFRDPAAIGGAGFNLSDGIGIPFAP